MSTMRNQVRSPTLHSKYPCYKIKVTAKLLISITQPEYLSICSSLTGGKLK